MYWYILVWGAQSVQDRAGREILKLSSRTVDAQAKYKISQSTFLCGMWSHKTCWRQRRNDGFTSYPLRYSTWPSTRSTWLVIPIGLSRCNNYMPVGNLPCRKRENDQFLAAIGWIAATLIKLLLWLYWICIANIDHTWQIWLGVRESSTDSANRKTVNPHKYLR